MKARFIVTGFIIVAISIVSVFLTRGSAKTNCDNAITTVDMVECANADYEAADKELNRVYKQLSSAVEKGSGK